MIILYHSRGAVAAHQAAAIHTGRIALTKAADIDAAWRLLHGPLCAHKGLCNYGEDETGTRIYALGRASRPDVVHRSFLGMANVAGVPSTNFLLQNVGPPIAWMDISIQLAILASSARLVRTLERCALSIGWADSVAAVAEARRRLEWRGGSTP